MTPETPDALRVLMRVAEILGVLEIRYHVGGSYASSVHGLPRQTQDVDFVAALRPGALRGFVERVRGEFYVDAAAAENAMLRRDSFNLIHLGSAIKVDVFIQGDDEFDRLEMERSRPITFESGAAIFVKAAEDTILRKLQWYRDGGGVSERQWLDVLGILGVQGQRLDREYLERWSRHLGVEDLLSRALREA